MWLEGVERADGDHEPDGSSFFGPSTCQASPRVDLLYFWKATGSRAEHAHLEERRADVRERLKSDIPRHARYR